MRKGFKNKWLKSYLILTISIFFIEIIFRLADQIKLLEWANLRIFIFSNILSLFLSYISSLFKTKITKIINLVLVFLFCLYALIQLGFNNFLGVYISLNTSSQLGAVIDYIREYILSFNWYFYFIFLPFIFLGVYYLFIDKRGDIPKYKKEYQLKFRIQKSLFLILGESFWALLYILSLNLNFMQNKLQLISNKDLLKNPTIPSIAVKQLGIFTFGLADLKCYLFPLKEVESLVQYTKVHRQTTDYSRKIDDSAFENVITNENNSTYQNLNNYFINQDITDKNDYTGYFEGKNLIVIMMESVNDIIIDADLYPNFYKLYSEGWSWENNYSPRNSCSTGNNELAGMVSLYSIYNSCTANVYKNNTYYESIFNLFNNKDYYTSSMHDFTEGYYRRKAIHTNMGSQKYYGVKDLNINFSTIYGTWASDEDFMDSFLKIVNSETGYKGNYMTWLTTVSSHQPYSVSSKFGDMYLSLFDNYDYPTDLKRYMSKLKVLDNALGILLKGLEENGTLDNTVIVLYGDHYPYGLSKSTINRVLNYELADYEVERVPFVIYNSQLEPKVFSKYTSYINLLPTIANLFNLDYDPRLYMGTDLFSKEDESLVVFADGSWKNEKAYFNASTGKVTNYNSADIYTDEEIRQISQTVSDQIKISNIAIKNNYFFYLESALKKYTVEETKAVNGIREEN